MFTVFIVIDGHFLLTLELEIIDGHHRLCHPKPWARIFVGRIFVFIDALKYSAIPFCILLVLSILIIQRVFHAEGISAQLQNLRPLHQYRQYSRSSSPNSRRHSSTFSMSTNTNSNLLTSNTRVSRRVTLMLLSVSIAFCVFSAPMSMMQIVQSIVEPDHHEVPLAIGKAIAELCQYINHSSNFFLYALTGRIFRREFVRLFFPTRLGNRKNKTTAMIMNTRILAGRTAAACLPPLSTRQPSLYSMDINRLKIYNHRHDRHTGAHLNNGYHPMEFVKPINRSSTIRKPLLTSNSHQTEMINHCDFTPSEPVNPLMNFWNIFGKRRNDQTIDDGLFSYTSKSLN